MSSSISAAAVSSASAADPKKTAYQRVQSMFPGIDIWLAPNCVLNCVNGEVNEARIGDATNRRAPPSVWRRVRDKCLRVVVTATSRSAIQVKRPKVLPTNALEVGSHSFDFELTEPERRYLEYLKRSIGEGQFSYYLLPAQS